MNLGGVDAEVVDAISEWSAIDAVVRVAGEGDDPLSLSVVVSTSEVGNAKPEGWRAVVDDVVRVQRRWAPGSVATG
jgi:hypothetical protein